MKKAIMALTVGFLFYVLSDILLWQRIFERDHLWSYDNQYQTGHLTILVGYIAIGVILLWDNKLWALWYMGAFYTLAFSGLADVLYYWLDAKLIPTQLPWLDSNPFLVHPATNINIVLSSILWMMFWTIPLVLSKGTRLVNTSWRSGV